MARAAVAAESPDDLGAVVSWAAGADGFQALHVRREPPELADERPDVLASVMRQAGAWTWPTGSESFGHRWRRSTCGAMSPSGKRRCPGADTIPALASTRILAVAVVHRKAVMLETPTIMATECGRCGHAVHAGIRGGPLRCATEGCFCKEWVHNRCPGSDGVSGPCPGAPFDGAHTPSCPEHRQRQQERLLDERR